MNDFDQIQIMIDPKLAQIQTKIGSMTQTQVVSHEDLIQAFSSNTIATVIPDNCVYMAVNGCRYSYLISLPPEVKNVRWTERYSGRGQEKKLPFPRTLFLFNLDFFLLLKFFIVFID